MNSSLRTHAGLHLPKQFHPERHKENLLDTEQLFREALRFKTKIELIILSVRSSSQFFSFIITFNDAMLLLLCLFFLRTKIVAIHKDRDLE